MEEVYFDELFELQEEVNKRKLLEWRMELAITENPHLQHDDRLILWKQLREESQTFGQSLDEVSMETLKLKLKQNPRIIVK